MFVVAAEDRRSGRPLHSVVMVAALILASAACGAPTSKPSQPAAADARDAGSEAKPRGESLRIAIAMDAAPAFKQVAEAYERSTGVHVEVASGLSNDLADDIDKHGVPFDAYGSPKPLEIDRLVGSQFCSREPTVVYGQQRIAMWTKPGVEPPKLLTDLTDPKWGKIVMTMKSPYGRLAKDILTRHGAWDAVAPKIVEVLGMNDFEKQVVNADVGITVLSVAIRMPGNYVEVDPSEYPKKVLEQLIPCKGAHAAPSDAVKQFLAFVATEPSRAILKRAGFY